MVNKIFEILYEIQEEYTSKYKNSIPQKAFKEALSHAAYRIAKEYIDGTEE